MNVPPRRSALTQVALVASTGGFLFGYDTAVINGANQFLTTHFALTPFWEGLAAASAILGCAPGALLGGMLSDRLGRKKTLLLCALLFLFSGIGCALPTHFTLFLLARFVGGVAIGVCSMVCPVYISECSPADRRGQLGSLFQLGIVVGIFITLFINALVQSLGDTHWNEAYGWRWMLGSEVVPALLFLVLLRSIPESPRWLIQQGRNDLAREVFGRWLNSKAIDFEMSSVSAAITTEVGDLSEIFKKDTRRPLLIAVALGAISQLSGINAIMYYSTRIFATAGTGIGNAFTATVYVGLINLLFTLVAVALMDRAGRRPLLLIGITVQVLSLVTVALLFYTQISAVALLIAILIFIASFAVALGPIPWLISSEIFPGRIRAKAMSFVAFTVWVGCFVVAQTFPLMNDSSLIGPAGTFCVYAAISLVGLIFVIFWIPETKGQSLEEIQRALSHNRNPPLSNDRVLFSVHERQTDVSDTRVTRDSGAQMQSRNLLNTDDSKR